MKRYFHHLLIGSLVALAPLLARAQAPVGNGLRGDYYDGLNFDHFVATRLDASLNFDWLYQQPLNGVPAEYFTVRWTGWLLPPVTGRYVLRLAVDDGIRLWLDGRQLLDEWRGQPLSYFEAPVELQAGRPYRLRLEYSQYSRGTRVLLSWERPRQPEPFHSWRNLWGLTDTPLAGNRYQEIIPTRYLFSHFPATTPRAAAPAASSPPPLPIPISKPAARVAKPRPAPRKAPIANSLLKVTKNKTPIKQATSSAASTRVQRADTLAAHLAKGQALTLPTLYFEQGKADLPIPVQASLDTLAQALTRYPALRLEVQGHTDNQGDPELNQQLSQRRAEAVCRYLAGHGVARSRLHPLGLGGTQPVADNNLPAERPRNRRVVLRPLP